MSDITNNDVEKTLCDRAVLIQSLDEYNVWEEQCDAFIISLSDNDSSKRRRLNMASQRSLVAQIIRLETLKATTRSRFIHTGEGLNDQGLIWRKIDSAFTNRVLTGAVINRNYIDPRQFLLDSFELVALQVSDNIKKHNSVKANTEFNGKFAVGDKRADKSIITRTVELFATSDLNEWYQKQVVEPTLKSLDEFQESDSGWTLISILNLTLNVNKYNAMRAGCHIALSKHIRLKKAVINIKSNDHACFGWAVVAALHPTENHSDRPASYPHYSTVLNLTGINFPMTLDQITKFEHLNNNLSINVYSAPNDSVLPIRVSKYKKETHINLLYIEDAREGNIGHFAWIKNLSRLVSKQLSAHNGQRYICDR